MARQTYKNRSVNFIDVYAFISFVAVSINLILYYISSYEYEVIWVQILIFLFFGILLFHIIRTFQTYKDDKVDGNLKDFKDLYEGKITRNQKEEIIVFEEKEVDYDLLNQNTIVNQLYESVQNITPQSKILIGIEGEWGSGKSTVLNLVKKKVLNEKTNCIIIDRFDPWHFNDEKSMLEAMLESIIDKIKLGLPSIKTTSLIKEFVNNIFKTSGFVLFDNIISKSSNINDSRVINIINNYLKKNDLKIVFLIDNLDRTQKEHVFFIYKAIASLINIKRMVFIIAYDPKVVNKALENLEIEDKYLEKIIQVKFKIEPHKNVLRNVEITALKEFYKLFGIDDEGFDEKHYLTLVNQFNNLREFKLFLNNLFYVLRLDLKQLNTSDLAAVNLIKTLNPNLFNLIRNNSKFFITEGLIDNVELSILRFNDEQLQKDAIEFFDKHSKEDYWKDYNSLLESLFPVVKKYNKNEKSLYKESSYDGKKSTKEKRVSNAKYFPVYFYETINNFIVIDEYVEHFIKEINSSASVGAVYEKEYIDIIELDEYSQILFFETLDLNIDKVDQGKNIDLMKFLAVLSHFLDDSSTGFSFRLNAKSRATVIIARILYKLDKENFKEVIREFKNDYSNFYLIRNLQYWFSEKAQSSGLYDKDKYSILDELFNQMANTVIEKMVDLYDVKFYSRYNARSIEWSLGVNEQTIKYFNNIVNKENIGKFLYDFMSVSSSSEGYGYTIDRESVHKFIKEEIVQTLISKANKTNDNSFVFEVYEKSKEKPIRGFESAILRKEEVKLFKLY